MRYQAWQSRDLSKTEAALLRMIVEAWRSGQAIDRDAAEFELVTQGYAYRDVQKSVQGLLGKNLVVYPPVVAPAWHPMPTLAGLIELGDAACEADLVMLARMIEALRVLYSPERRRVSLDDVCETSGVARPAVERLAAFTGVYAEADGEFLLSNEVLGWSSFDEFLRTRVFPRSAPPVAEKKPPALHVELLPNVVSWSNLGPYKDAVLELSPLTVLIGANASGKTSALRALDLLSKISERGLDSVDLEKQGGNLAPSSPLGLVRQGSQELSFCVGGELRKRGKAWTRCQWSTELLLSPRVAVRHELFELADQRPAAELHFGIGHWPGEGGRPEDVHLRPNQLALREAENPRCHAELIGMRQSLQGWRVILEKMNEEELLALLENVDDGRLQELVHAVLGPVRLRRAGRQLVSVQRHGYAVPLLSGPRGLLHVVTVLAHLLQPTPPALLAFDEIENHLHADVAERLIEVLRGFTNRTRIVVTTHSGNVLRAVSPEEVRLVRPGERFSGIVRIDRDPMLNRLAKSGSMAELLEGGFLTVPA